ncbi:MAG TPA: DUF6159 family protein [Pirellulales bacterium]|nr:DUF6159 family protein [Pirellulales bacterium]
MRLILRIACNSIGRVVRLSSGPSNGPGRQFFQTWGEQIVAGWSFGLIFLGLFLVVGAIAGAGAFAAFSAGIPALAGACIVLGVMGVVGLALVQSALQTIFQTALYLYAKGVEEEGFPKELMAQALRAK